MSFYSYGGPALSSASDQYWTPQYLADELQAEFGVFTLDPAADENNTKAERFYTKDDDGLSQPWNGIVFVNPPYGRQLAKWVDKAISELPNCERIIMLVPARTDTKWFNRAAEHASLIRFFKGRIRFENSVWKSPFPVCIIVFDRLHTGQAVMQLGKAALCTGCMYGLA